MKILFLVFALFVDKEVKAAFCIFLFRQMNEITEMGNRAKLHLF